MSENKRHPRIINQKDVEPRVESRGKNFGFTGKRLGMAAGAQNIGTSLIEIPPGRQAFPHHYHCVNEEAVYVLEGKGTVRIGNESHEISVGDYIAFLPGPEMAHSIKNTSDKPLKLLAMSTLKPHELVGYPDSKKIAAYAGDSIANGLRSNLWLRVLINEQPNVDYYDGEKTD